MSSTATSRPDPAPPLRRLVLLVGAIVLVDTMFFAAITPLLPEYSDRLDLSKASAGVLSASYAVGALVGSLPAGWLAARWGVRPTVLLGLAILGVSSVVFGFADNVLLLDAARFAQGAGGGGLWAGGMAWLIAAAPRDRRAELMGGALGAAIFGALLGPALGALASVAGHRADVLRGRRRRGAAGGLRDRTPGAARGRPARPAPAGPGAAQRAGARAGSG